MLNKVKFKQLDKYQYKDTLTLKVYNSIDVNVGHNEVEFNEMLAEMNRRRNISNLSNHIFTFEDEDDMMLFMLTWGN